LDAGQPHRADADEQQGHSSSAKASCSSVVTRSAICGVSGHDQLTTFVQDLLRKICGNNDYTVAVMTALLNKKIRSIGDVDVLGDNDSKIDWKQNEQKTWRKRPEGWKFGIFSI